MITQDIVMSIIFLFVLIFASNIGLAMLDFGINIPYKLKRYTGKVNPIYKLVEGNWDNDLYIAKYVLTWRKSDDVTLLWFVPFYLLLKFKRYVRKKKYGGWDRSKLEDIFRVDSLLLVYENYHTEYLQEKANELTKYEKEKVIIDNNNIIFDENYE